MGIGSRHADKSRFSGYHIDDSSIDSLDDDDDDDDFYISIRVLNKTVIAVDLYTGFCLRFICMTSALFFTISSIWD